MSDLGGASASGGLVGQGGCSKGQGDYQGGCQAPRGHQENARLSNSDEWFVSEIENKIIWKGDWAKFFDVLLIMSAQWFQFKYQALHAPLHIAQGFSRLFAERPYKQVTLPTKHAINADTSNRYQGFFVKALGP